MIENVDWSLHWIEFGDVSLDVVDAVLLCPAESFSPHELVQITGQLDDCRSVHGFKSSFAFFSSTTWCVRCVRRYLGRQHLRSDLQYDVEDLTVAGCRGMHATGPNGWCYRVESRSGWSAEGLLHLVCWPDKKNNIQVHSATSYLIFQYLQYWYNQYCQESSSICNAGITSIFQNLQYWYNQYFPESFRIFQNLPVSAILVLPVFSRIFQYLQYWYNQYFPESFGVCNTHILAMTSIF